MPDATLTRQMRETRDPFLRGDLAVDQRSLGYGLTHGRRFPLKSGAVALLRRALYPVPDEWHYCGLAWLDDTSINNRAAYGHGANTAWQYTAMRIHGNGYAAPTIAPIRLDFDGAGAIITPLLPLWPILLTAKPIATGEFKISWGYNAWGQGGEPKDFVIYEGPDEDNIDYQTPLGTVAFRAGRDTFTFETSGSYGEGTAHAFAVRTRSLGDVAEQNTYTTAAIKAMVTAPAAAEIQTVSPLRQPRRR